MSYKLKNKSDGIGEYSPIYSFKNGPCTGLEIYSEDSIPYDCNELYFKVSNNDLYKEQYPVYTFCRINLKDLSIMGCEDETLKLTEEQYKQVIDKLYDQVDYINESKEIFTYCDLILDCINNFCRDESNLATILLPPTGTYNYTYTKEE